MLLKAVALDLALGEVFPGRLHPVVWTGKAIAVLQRAAPGKGCRGGLSKGTSGRVVQLLYGLAMAVLIPGTLAVVAFFAFDALLGASGPAYLVVGALVLNSTFAVRMLGRAATSVYRSLEASRIEEARSELGSLVSRDTRCLSPELAAAAAVESVAENTTDSFVGPWLAFALFGLPGALAYRAVNTLDSMIGYRGKYEYLGKASARLDDIVNLIPARLSAMLILAADAFRPGSFAGARRGWRMMWRDHGLTASPNAGWTMSSMAGVLGVRLEKTGEYRLGDGGRAPVPGDIRGGVHRMYFVAASALAIALGVLALRWAVS